MICKGTREWSLGGVILVLVMASQGCVYTKTVTPRPEGWAEKVDGEGLPNLYRVSPSLYRSALPDMPGLESAEELGIKTVVNLRPGKDAADFAAKGVPGYVNIPVRTSEPTYEQARQFFELVDDPKRVPVLLHCYHGADRTGAFVALYRVNREGWSKEEAIREMTGGGYHFHTMWKSLIEWVREAPTF